MTWLINRYEFYEKFLIGMQVMIWDWIKETKLKKRHSQSIST